MLNPPSPKTPKTHTLYPAHEYPPKKQRENPSGGEAPGDGEQDPKTKPPTAITKTPQTPNKGEEHGTRKKENHPKGPKTPPQSYTQTHPLLYV